jgi:copper chaperone CopZ
MHQKVEYAIWRMPVTPKSITLNVLTLYKVDEPMETKTLYVPNIGCDGCVRTIKAEVSQLAGVARVDADKDTKQVTVEWTDPATLGQIKALLAEIDYPVAQA